MIWEYHFVTVLGRVGLTGGHGTQSGLSALGASGLCGKKLRIQEFGGLCFFNLGGCRLSGVGVEDAGFRVGCEACAAVPVSPSSYTSFRPTLDTKPKTLNPKP